MQPPKSNPPSDKREEPTSTRERLLAAAYRVCAERGLHSATTREIAEAAHVNEVTLFRHFGNKEALLSVLLERSVAAQSEALNIDEPESNNLEDDLLHYANRFDQMLLEHEPLIRTLIGDAHRHPEQAKKVIYDSARPMRQRLIDYLRARQKSGVVRRDLEVEPAIDAFTGMLLSGMLRRTGAAKMLEYTHEDFVNTAVDLFVRAISGSKAERSRKSQK
jgi:AcrR family transcriptional regulator